MKGSLYSCLLIVHLPSGSRTLTWHFETINREGSTYKCISKVSKCPAYQERLVVLKLDLSHIDPFSLVFLFLQCKDVLGREGGGEEREKGGEVEYRRERKKRRREREV